MSAAPSIVRALQLTLRNATLEDRAAAAVALCKRYATLLDEASTRAAYRRPLAALERAARAADLREETDEYSTAFAKIADALGQHSTASDLGPKLLAALAALGLTLPAAGKDHQHGSPAAAARDELRSRRRARADRTAHLDATAP